MSSPQLAATIVAGLVQAQAGFVVMCSGSRNAPISMALVDAHNAGLLNVTVRVDERGAGFMALGAAKATGQVAAVVVTSGTAVGNLLPAVMEASHSGVPLLIISADRPATMRGTGANQTTDQAGIFGDFLRGCFSVSSDQPSTWLAQISAALTTAAGITQRRPGPVQLNVELAEPLLGDPRTDVAAAVAAGGWELAANPLPRRVADLGQVAGSVIVVGDATPAEGSRAVACAQAARLPIFAEPSSNARTPGAIQHYRELLCSALGAHISRAIVFGRPTLSRPQRALLTDVDVIQVNAWAHDDRLPGTVQVVDDVSLPCDESDWLQRWQDADAALARSDHGENEPDDGLEPDAGGVSGAALVRLVLASCTSGHNLVWGPSQLIRDADSAPIFADLACVYANRGLAGIDGMISTAMGIALASSRPTVAVLGDVTALHDLSALVIPSTERRPDLRLVIGSDDGGAIFGTLEQGAPAYAQYFDRCFRTPHGQHIASITASLGIQSRRIATQTELSAALHEPISGIDLIEVDVLPREHTTKGTE